MADALSRRPRSLISTLMIQEWQALEIFVDFDLPLSEAREGRYFGCLVIQPDFDQLYT